MTRTTGNWTQNEMAAIAQTDDLHVSPFRDDGKTYGTPTWIWSVVVDDGLYVRAYYGQASRWYQAAMRQKAGRITAAGMTKEVEFDPVNGPINDQIDEAYQAKYKGSPYLPPMIGARARSATVKISPRRGNALSLSEVNEKGLTLCEEQFSTDHVMCVSRNARNRRSLNRRMR